MSSSNLTIIVRSHAKVNLTLDVLSRRPDEFHAIESVMQSIGLHDTVTLHVRGERGIRVSCDLPDIPTDERNLAYKSASMLLLSRGLSLGLDIHLEKRIPAEAGLGGGSSNAAAVLIGLNRLLGLSASREDLCNLAARIGSDVPFFLVGGTALVRGRGEEVHPLPDIRPWWLVVVKPPFGVSTAWAYRRLDEIRLQAADGRQAGEPETHTLRMVKCIENEKCVRLPELLRNDLEAPAFEQHPEIARIKDGLLDAGASGALMCGSGSALFGLFESRDTAENAASRFDGDHVFLTKTIIRTEALQIG